MSTQLPERKRVFRIRCPRCEYVYSLSTSGVPVWENCPYCGHSDFFSNFGIEEVNDGFGKQRDNYTV